MKDTAAVTTWLFQGDSLGALTYFLQPAWREAGGSARWHQLEGINPSQHLSS